MRNNVFYVLLWGVFLAGVMNAQSALLETMKDENLVIVDTILVFQSSFGGTTQVVPYGDTGDDTLVGSDSLPKSCWDALRTDDIGIVHFNYTGGDVSKRCVKIVDDPMEDGNKVLLFSLNDYWLASENQEKARIQLEFHEIKGGYKELYQTVRVYLAEDFDELEDWEKGFEWLTISEYWNNEWWVSGEKHGFRISVNIAKEAGEGKQLYFKVDSQDQGFIGVWGTNNRNVRVPIGEWFTVEYYFKEGDDQSGRFYMAITPDGGEKLVICDVHNFTHNTSDRFPDGITAYNPIKLYTSKELVEFMKSKGKALRVYWDDLKLWKVGE